MTCSETRYDDSPGRRRKPLTTSLWPECRAGLLCYMKPKVTVSIVASPVACAGGVKNTWRDVAAWAADRLTGRFGESVEVRYFDLFDPACPALPADAQLPLVLVNGEVVSSGGKISIPAIRKRIEALGLTSSDP